MRSAGKSVTFHSDMAGEVTVPWSKIRELHSSRQFAIVQKNVKLGKNETDGKIPQGTVSMNDQKLQIQTAAQTTPQIIPVDNTAYVIDEQSFQKAVLHNPTFREDWKGAITAGTSLVVATQKSRTYTGNLSLIRAIPSEDWLDPRNRTTLNLSAAYGILTQPDTPKLKTEIYHADAERDEYFTPQLYAFGQLAYDHNFSQGLDLQQSYGAGIGWTVIKRENEEFDLKVSLSYLEQQFQETAKNTALFGSAEDQNLFGSTFAERFNHRYAHNILFTEQIAATPAWNNTNAYSATGNAALTMPVYKRLNFTIGTVDTFLNNPSPGFKKNSFQLTTGLTYMLH